MLFVGGAIFAEGATIKVTIKGVERESGNVQVSLVTKEQFLLRRKLKKAHMGKNKSATIAPMSFAFKNVEPGDYAFQVMHDENGNGKFDVSKMGLPVEKWGMSRNPKVRFRPPGWDATRFTVAKSGEEVRLEINLRYR